EHGTQQGGTETLRQETLKQIHRHRRAPHLMTPDQIVHAPFQGTTQCPNRTHHIVGGRWRSHLLLTYASGLMRCAAGHGCTFSGTTGNRAGIGSENLHPAIHATVGHNQSIGAQSDTHLAHGFTAGTTKKATYIHSD